MAQSRLEKLGTIFTRTQTLLKGNALKQEDLPLWYNIYESFPPKHEPRFDRAVPETPIKKIFYKEDIVRAQFQKENTNLPIINLRDNVSQTATHKFLSIYENLMKAGTNEDILYQQALEEYKSQVKGYQAAKIEAAKPQEKSTPNKKESEVESKKNLDGPAVSLKSMFDQ